MIDKRSIFSLVIGLLILAAYFFNRLGFSMFTDIVVLYVAAVSVVVLFLYLVFISFDIISILFSEEKTVSREYANNIVTGITAGLIVSVLNSLNVGTIWSPSYWFEILVGTAVILPLLAIMMVFYMIMHEETDYSFQRIWKKYREK
ncbi:MAG: hypothetical protein ACI9LV_000709 [Candidatus Nanohaloarchaea archaeon]|jgi:hypothetical protein